MLNDLRLPFEVRIPDIEESPRPGETSSEFAERAAMEKALAVAEELDAEAGERLVIAGDTVVVSAGKILGKPGDEEDAKAMLRGLSGRTHEVISGLCVLKVVDGKIAGQRSMAVSTEVVFKELSNEEIANYVRTGEPMDKAGAYAIQGGAGYMISHIEGSHSNVVGLPLCELIEILTDYFGYSWPWE